jgi:hypothetical protein
VQKINTISTVAGVSLRIDGSPIESSASVAPADLRDCQKTMKFRRPWF